jgi:hypothetical protein
MRLGENKQSSQKSSKSSPRRKSQQTKNEMPENTDKDGKSEGEDVNKNVAKKCDKANTVEKRVSFDSNVANNSNEESKGQRRVSLSPKSKREDNAEEVSTPEVHFAKEETTPVELCDIEPLSGTVFRKVTVRRRRQDMRKIPAVDTGESLRQIHSFCFLWDCCFIYFEYRVVSGRKMYLNIGSIPTL